MGGPSKPKAPKAKAPPPTESSADVVQETEFTKRKALLKGGRKSTILNPQTNAAKGGKTLLGQ